MKLLLQWTRSCLGLHHLPPVVVVKVTRTKMTLNLKMLKHKKLLSLAWTAVCFRCRNATWWLTMPIFSLNVRNFTNWAFSVAVHMICCRRIPILLWITCWMVSNWHWILSVLSAVYVLRSMSWPVRRTPPSPSAAAIMPALPLICWAAFRAVPLLVLLGRFWERLRNSKRSLWRWNGSVRYPTSLIISSSLWAHRMHCTR